MAGKNPVMVVAGLVLVLVALGLYQWTVLQENASLREETSLARQMLGKLKREKEEVQNRLAEISMTLDNKKRYISDIDGKFLKANADMESKNTALQRCTTERDGCIAEKKKVGEEAAKQKNELKAKTDQLAKTEEERKKVQTELEEFKKLCAVVDMTKELPKKLCPQAPASPPKA
uniref:protein GOLM2-like n=1 Tax=Pristiophorus japonicus TaxID=55135 RepID=UPI00398F2202